MLNNLKQFGGILSDEDFEMSMPPLTFTAILSSGEEVELCPGGENKSVTKANYSEYIDLVLKARSNETSEQMKSVIAGMKIAL